MNLFYTNDIQNDRAFFEQEEARHALQVLRKKKGDTISFTDGKGVWYEGIIDETGKAQFAVLITSTVIEPERKFRLHVAIAPTKHTDRFEWFLEKATELGIDEVTPVLCANSERLKLKIERGQRILLSAMKQSLKAQLPVLNELVSFKDLLIKISSSEKSADRYIAHCRSGNSPHLKHNYSAGKDVCILIGPEGDFTEEEVALAEHNGWKSISLGSSRLRTETAGIAACHLVNLINDN